MQCPNCRGENPSNSTKCYYCGAPLMNQPYGNTQMNQPYSSQPYGQQPYGSSQGQQTYGAPNGYRPSNGGVTLRTFIKSPLMLCAIIAFTTVAVLQLINFFDSMEALEYYFDALGEEPFLVIGALAGHFMFISYALIAGGLWKMYLSNGTDESSLACGGFTAFAVMSAIGVGFPLLDLLTEDGGFDFFFENLGEYYLVPIAMAVIAVIAALNAKKMLAEIGHAAVGGRADANSASAAGIWCVIYGGLALLVFFGVFEEMGMGNPSEYLEGVNLISQIADIAAFCMLGVAGFSFKNLLIGGAPQNPQNPYGYR